MQLVSMRLDGRRRAGALDEDGNVLFLDEGEGGAFAAGSPIDAGVAAARAALDRGGERRALAAVQLAAPVTPGKIVCVGANYAEHVRESGAPMPTEPILFLKVPDTVIGPADDICVPR